jgi:hypothetical protein
LKMSGYCSNLDADSQRSDMERPTLTLPPLRGGSLPLPQGGRGAR